jgi:hypothetical protein
LVCKDVELLRGKRLWVNGRLLKHSHGNISTSCRLFRRNVDDKLARCGVLSRLVSLRLLLLLAAIRFSANLADE